VPLPTPDRVTVSVSIVLTVSKSTRSVAGTVADADRRYARGQHRSRVHWAKSSPRSCCCSPCEPGPVTFHGTEESVVVAIAKLAVDIPAPATS
jgi:hypothetical protein